MKCRCCKNKLKLFYSFKKPNITSNSKIVNLNKYLYKCNQCSLIQSSSVFNLKKYYSDNYNLSLESKNHDFFYQKVGNRIIFKSDVQLSIIKKFLKHNKKINILDYGCAKSDVMKKCSKKYKYITPYLFDISSKYKKHWNFALKENQSINIIPKNWKNRFDIITNFFVLEHDNNPLKTLTKIRDLLKENGRLILVVPNSAKNIGDHLLVDHLNHFNKSSLVNILNFSGFKSIKVFENLYKSSLVVSCKKGQSNKIILKDTNQTKMINFLKKYTQKILKFKKKELNLDNYAIYGAGIYGTYIHLKFNYKINYFIDQNPYLKNKNHFSAKVLSPYSLPKKITKIFVALNPYVSKKINFSKIYKTFKGRKLEYFF